MRAAAISNSGMIRQVNEDSYLCASEIGLFAVADGMGGHACGDFASAIAVEVLRETVTEETDNDPGELLVHAIQAVNKAISTEAEAKPEARGMGTTVVAGLVEENILYFAWVGDSRLYHFRDATLQQLSSDHSLVAELCARGIITPEEAKNHHQKNIITRACGTAATVEVDLGDPLPLQPGDTIIFCSDGLTTHLEDEDICRYIIEHHDDLEKLCNVLVDETNARGGTDNITLVVVAF
ncbi:MAG: Stp1/IreP family PP2C-type Ser/Thr phosphatase [bacterium]|jgi:protein phosphatase|nr:Stp1/IreP family PP2C-type Ser/Thr phosphatase [bacterium]